MTLGQKIKSLRNEKSITQKDLSEKLNVSFQTVSKWENDENEPDVATLRELSKIFGCTVDYLLSEDESTPKTNEPAPAPVAPTEVVTKTIVIHQKELHVCERCKKDIPEDELAMEQVCTRHARRGHHAEYRQAYYHKACLEQLQKERAIAAEEIRAEKESRAKKLSFGWGIAGGVVALTISLLVMLLYPAAQDVIHPALAVLYSVLIGYGIFAMLYCIITGSYIGEVFLWCAKLSIKFPGLIFSWDLGGLAWLIVMKILFAIIGFLVGVFALFFAIGLSALLGAFSFPFVLIHNINNQYEDALCS